MKTIAIIGASYLQRPLVLKAKQMGLRTICFAWPKDAVCKDLVDVFYPISIVEKEAILSVCQSEQISGICTIASDVAAPTVAYVAEQMGLVGNSYDAALRANNKFLMRSAFAIADVPCPLFACLSASDDLSSLPDFSFPLIVKPSDRSGSLGVSKVDTTSDLRAAVQAAQSFSFRYEAMVEEFIDGREISVECISFQGKHYPLQITDKTTTGAPHFVELAHHQPSSLPPALCDQVYATTLRALDALGITNGASHSEFKITSSGRIVIMEVGARMGGDFIGSDLVRLSTGYDFLQGVIDVSLGTFTPPVLSLHRCSGVYFVCHETAHLLPFLQRILASKQDFPAIYQAEQTNDTLLPVACSADRSGYFIYCDNQPLIL